MTALYIIAGILLLILLILLLRISITVSYRKMPHSPSEYSVIAGLGSFSFRVYPKKEKKIRLSDFSAKKYRALLAAEHTVREKQTVKEKPGHETFPRNFSEAFDVISRILKAFGSKITYELLRIRINVSAGNAASTALAYSALSSSLAVIFDIIDSHADVRLKSPKDIRITCDFDGSETHGDICIRFSIRVIKLIISGKEFIRSCFRAFVLNDLKESKK